MTALRAFCTPSAMCSILVSMISTESGNKCAGMAAQDGEGLPLRATQGSQMLMPQVSQRYRMTQLLILLVRGCWHPPWFMQSQSSEGVQPMPTRGWPMWHLRGPPTAWIQGCSWSSLTSASKGMTGRALRKARPESSCSLLPSVAARPRLPRRRSIQASILSVSRKAATMAKPSEFRGATPLCQRILLFQRSSRSSPSRPAIQSGASARNRRGQSQASHHHMSTARERGQHCQEARKLKTQRAFWQMAPKRFLASMYFM
mmetsp:Transcript_13317/g.37853  ORF Transcript_13317/g.37853 Transcript_13317/m.37853 type:complete len:259 (-) Transcript_13317:1068-1844(-)